MDESKKELLQKLGFEMEMNRVSWGECGWCGGECGEFRDALSVKEFGISGLCQQCQDDVFGGGEEKKDG